MTAPTLEAERAAFEAELTGRWTTELTRDSNGDEVYLDEDTAHAFIGWCMARRTSAPVAEDVALPPKQSIDTPEFRRLLHAMGATTGIPYHYNQLIAYIDGRTAGAAPPACRNQGGICACRAGGSFGGCAMERAAAPSPLPPQEEAK